MTPKPRGHRVYREDIPALKNGKPLKVQTLDVNTEVKAGFVVRYEPSPARLAVARTDYTPAELLDCSGGDVEVITEIWMLNDLADRWLVCEASRYGLVLCPFGKAP